MQFQRLLRVSNRAYFGFDHIEVFRLPFEPEPEPESTTKTSTKAPTSVYFCDFDLNDNCGGALSSNNSGLGLQFASVQSAPIGAYSVSDFSSIS